MSGLVRRGAPIILAAAALGVVALASISAVRAPVTTVTSANADVDVEHYAFRLSLSDESDVIEGVATIRLAARRDGVAAFELDLVGGAANERGMEVTSVSVSDAVPATGGIPGAGAVPTGDDVEFAHEDDVLRITTPHPLDSGERVVVEVAYRGIPGDGLIIGTNRHGARTFFGDNWPNRARHWLPSVDHPSDKATVEWIVEAPSHYQVVGSGAKVEETDLAGGRRVTHWRTDVPLPTKVMVIGAARFAVDHVRDVHGIPVTSWVYPEDREAGFSDFSRAADILDYFITHIGEYPYEKLANVQSTTRYGGMENASNIFYSENAVTGTGSNEGLLAHEIAHQWFGDSVTELDWHHIWISEGFATYFTQLWFEHVYGRERMNTGLRAQRNAIVAYADRRPDSPVVDTTIVDLNDLLSTNSYQKGGWVLHMLRREVGDEAFREGIRNYYADNRDGSALTSDLRNAMEEATGKSLAWFFDQWLRSPGQPMLDVSWSNAGDDRVTLVVTQTQDWSAFRFPLDVRFSNGDWSEVRTVEVTGQREEFSLTLPGAPTEAVLDPAVWLLHAGAIEQR